MRARDLGQSIGAFAEHLLKDIAFYPSLRCAAFGTFILYRFWSRRAFGDLHMGSTSANASFYHHSFKGDINTKEHELTHG